MQVSSTDGLHTTQEQEFFCLLSYNFCFLRLFLLFFYRDTTLWRTKVIQFPQRQDKYVDYEKKLPWIFFLTIWYVTLINRKFKVISETCICIVLPECTWFLCSACIEYNPILIFWWKLIIIKDLIPQLLYTQIIFWVQIRVCDSFIEWKVILPYQTSVDTAISELQWMLHYTATLVFVIKAISFAALQLTFCFWWPIIFVVSAWVDM